jgi:magnesium-transporting ATPase (P-type)
MKRHEYLTGVLAFITFALVISMFVMMSYADSDYITKADASAEDRENTRKNYKALEDLIISAFVFAILAIVSFLIFKNVRIAALDANFP